MNKKTIIILISLPFVFCGGCKLAALAVTPGPYDRKVPAEYNIKDRQDDKILVIVEESAGVRAGLVFREELAKAFNARLLGMVKLKRENVIVCKESDYFKKNGKMFSQVSPMQIGRDLGAGMVLYVNVINFELRPSGMEDLFLGSLAVRSMLVDANEKKILWPADGNPRLIRMAIDIETKGAGQVKEKLFSSTAHGVLRYLYDVRVRHFKTSAEQRQYNQEWDYSDKIINNK